MKPMSETDGLTQLILDDRIKGKSYMEIEIKHGVPAIEAAAMVREALESTTMRDPIEMRGIVMLRTEKIIEYMWAGVESGSFKHGETVIKALERLSELLDLNQETIRTEMTLISDAETLQLFEVMKLANQALYQKVQTLELSEEARHELTAWPEWTAEATTNAVETVLYYDEDSNTYK